MPGFAAGPIASVIEKIIGLVFDEDQLPELIKRRKLSSLNTQAKKQLASHDFTGLRETVEEMKRVSSQP